MTAARRFEVPGEDGKFFREGCEFLAFPVIEERFGELGFRFDDVSPWSKCRGTAGGPAVEFGLILRNAGTTVATCVKEKPGVRDVKRLQEKLEILRECRRGMGDGRKIQGAVAGAVFGTAQRKAALDAGFYVIVQFGDTMRMDIPEGFRPKVW